MEKQNKGHYCNILKTWRSLSTFPPDLGGHHHNWEQTLDKWKYNIVIKHDKLFASFFETLLSKPFARVDVLKAIGSVSRLSMSHSE